MFYVFFKNLIFNYAINKSLNEIFISLDIISSLDLKNIDLLLRNQYDGNFFWNFLTIEKQLFFIKFCEDNKYELNELKVKLDDFLFRRIKKNMPLLVKNLSFSDKQILELVFDRIEAINLYRSMLILYNNQKFNKKQTPESNDAFLAKILQLYNILSEKYSYFIEYLNALFLLFAIVGDEDMVFSDYHCTKIKKIYVNVVNFFEHSDLKYFFTISFANFLGNLYLKTNNINCLSYAQDLIHELENLYKIFIFDQDLHTIISKHIKQLENCVVKVELMTANQFSDNNTLKFTIVFNQFRKENIDLQQRKELEQLLLKFFIINCNLPAFVANNIIKKHYKIIYDRQLMRQKERSEKNAQNLNMTNQESFSDILPTDDSENNQENQEKQPRKSGK